ncbi:18968_t:CDS:2, partial [Gigaspora margarita]
MLATIEIDEETNCYDQKIDAEQSLSEFRRELLDLYNQNPIGRTCLYGNMLFVGKRGGIISQDAEDDCKLGDVLHDGNVIKIKRLSGLIDESEIIKQCKLEYGIKMSNDGPVEPHKSKKAFEFIKQDEVVELFQPIANIYNEVKIITQNSKHEILCQKNLIADLNVSTNLPWSSLSTGFRTSCKRSKDRTNYNETSMTFEIKLQGRAKVIMTDKVRSSKEFEKAVDDALKCPNPIEKLKSVCNEYGEYWAREIIIGGKIQTVQDDFVEINKQTEERTLGASSSINIKNFNANLQNTNLAQESFNEWIKSLEDYAKWRIVEYRDVVSIFEVLDDDDLRRRVLNTLGKNILYAKVDQRKLTFFPNQKPYRHELDIPEKYKKNLKDFQIFATVISEKQKGTFSVRVMYTNDNSSTDLHSANLLIHQFRKSGKSKLREYDLKIGWIIIGIPNDFNFFDFEGFNGLKESEVKLSKFSSNLLQDVKHDIYDKHVQYKTYPLVTCALKTSESLRYDPLALRIVTGIHFHHTTDKHLQMCIHNYDLAKNDSKGNNELLSCLSVQYCSVLEGKLCQNTIFGKKTKWTCVQPDFASIYQHEDCIPGLLKITSDNAVFKSFDK